MNHLGEFESHIPSLNSWALNPNRHIYATHPRIIQTHPAHILPINNEDPDKIDNCEM